MNLWRHLAMPVLIGSQSFGPHPSDMSLRKVTHCCGEIAIGTAELLNRHACHLWIWSGYQDWLLLPPVMHEHCLLLMVTSGQQEQ